MPYNDISAASVKERLDRSDQFRLIDVREPSEHATAAVDGAELLPLSTAREWLSTLPMDEELVIMCHHGGRSAQVASYLADQLGHQNVSNMVGGIDAWSTTVDAKVPRY